MIRANIALGSDDPGGRFDIRRRHQSALSQLRPDQADVTSVGSNRRSTLRLVHVRSSSLVPWKSWARCPGRNLPQFSACTRAKPRDARSARAARGRPVEHFDSRVIAMAAIRASMRRPGQSGAFVCTAPASHHPARRSSRSGQTMAHAPRAPRGLESRQAPPSVPPAPPGHVQSGPVGASRVSTRLEFDPQGDQTKQVTLRRPGQSGNRVVLE